MIKKCPRCSLVNPPSAIICDCGYYFASASNARENKQAKNNNEHESGPSHRVHTHYDNLKVARNAPIEVIRAAYKSLSQKYHPDKNPGSAEATRIMAIINASYDVLSDPDRRREHNLWVAQQEQLTTQRSREPTQINQSSIPTQKPRPNVSGISLKIVTAHVLRNWILYGIAGVFIWVWAIDEPSTPPPGPKPYTTSPSPQLPDRPDYVRPSTAPNGQPWPTTAAYIKGYKRLHTGGLSTVTVDNSRNDSNVFVKLVSLGGPEAYPVRQFFIPAFSSFSLNKVTAGSYDIRYRDLSSGGLSRSEAFILEETPTNNGTQFSNMTMTLYKVQNGNMQTYGLSETEF